MTCNGLRATSRIISAILILMGLATLSSGGCKRTEAMWNVLVIVLDTVRADHLSINGYPRETSPALDALAREGVNLTNAITVAPRTWQSFSSILTGLYPPHHGVRHIFDRPLLPTTPTLASTLRHASYETRAFDGPLLFLKKMTGGVAFDEYVIPERKVKSRNQDEALIEQLWEWISQERKAPFLAFVRLTYPHWPYVRNEWTDEFEKCEGHDHSFNRGSYGIEIGKPGTGIRLKNESAHRKLIWETNLDDRTLQHMIAHYDSAIRCIDTYIGHLIDRMRGSGILEKTIVVVTADHGESFGEHGYMQHGPRVDEPVMHVPMIIRLPQGHPAFNPGHVVNELVRVVDIFPTILDAVRVPAPDGLDGVSLLPALRGGRLPALWAYGEAGCSFTEVDPERHYQGVEGKHRMIRTADWKLVFIPSPEGGEYRLFDLHRDPGERTDIKDEHSDVLAALRAHLEAILSSEKPRTDERKLSTEENENLRSLGYLQ